MVETPVVGREVELPERADFEAATLPHLKSLFRFALRLTGDPTLAEDLVQETYLKALQSFSTLRDPARVRPWLFQILKGGGPAVLCLPGPRPRGRVSRGAGRTSRGVPGLL